MNYNMSRFEVAAVQQAMKRTPEQYIVWCGGVERAKANYNSVRGQSKDGVTSPFWEQVNAICKKAAV